MPELERRLVYVRVSSSKLFDLMTEGYTTNGIITVAEGLPKDAKFVRDYFDPKIGCVFLLFTHPSFQEVPDYAEIPVKNILLKTTYPEYREEVEEL